MVLSPPSPLMLWGKADPEVGPEPHPAPLHMLDVAAVAAEMLDGVLSPAVARDLLQPTRSRKIRSEDLAFIVACHDLGKLTPGFQAKVPHLRGRLAFLGLTFPDTAETNHAVSGATLGPRLLRWLGAGESLSHLAAAAVAAHHGQVFPSEPYASNRYGGVAWEDVRRDAVGLLKHALGASPDLLDFEPSEHWLMLLCGLTVAADWIGSDTRFFPYEPHGECSRDYFARARTRAKSGLRSLGWTKVASWSCLPSFVEMFPGRAPRPMQQKAIEIVDGFERPGFLVIEAATGSGKTEAALYAAESMMTRFDLGGFYFALPTQATSNQMFRRIRDHLERRPAGGMVNLHLLHSTRDFQDDYVALRTRSVDEVARGVHSVLADTWFHGRKRGLLSPFAVGTVDQVMMAALQTRHFFLRLFGMARKVVIVDEVHAYDAYMSRILDRLLVWLRELGCGVVLLSATLPPQRLSELVSAWSGSRALVERPPYPRITAHSGSTTADAIPREATDGRNIAIRWIGADSHAVVAHFQGLLSEGGCGAWIHNTVGEAQAGYRALIEAGWPREQVILFHARFPLDQRLEKESKVLDALSRNVARPKRLLVVATQVIEQSLDIDVDAMVSAVAPVDLLLQRAGRLHRHPERMATRPPGLDTPTLWVSVDESDSGPSLRPSSFVYDEHILLRSWWALREARQIVIPDDADELLKAVYPAEESGAVPDGLSPEITARWQASRDKLVQTLARARARGAVHLVPMPAREGSDESFLDNLQKALVEFEDAPEKHEDVLARTRDIEMNVTGICLNGNEAQAFLGSDDLRRVPLREPAAAADLDRSLVRSLVGRSVALQAPDLVRRLLQIPVPPAWQTNSYLRAARPLVFDSSGRMHMGEGLALRLDDDLGIVIERAAAA